MAPGCMRLVLLAATVHTTAAALALPSVLTTRGHNATAYVVAAAPGGTEHDITLSLREDLSRATLDGGSSANEKRQALRTLEEVAGVMRRVLGPTHPSTLHAQRQLEHYRGSQ